MTGYATTAPLAARIAIHAHGTNPTSWYAFVRALLPPARALLDAGAGTGALWGEDPPRGLVAVDSSAAMCAALRSRGIAAARASAGRLPFGDGTFDGAVCAHVLYHLPDPAAGVRELRRVVRAGGWAAVATNGAGHMREVSDLAVAAGLPAADVHERFAAERLGAALGEVFGEVTTHAYDDTLAVPAAGPVVDYVASLGPLPPAAAAAVRAAAEERIARDGAFRVAKHTVLALAR